MGELLSGKKDRLQICPYLKVLACESCSCITRSRESYVIGQGCKFGFLWLVSVRSGDKIRKVVSYE